MENIKENIKNKINIENILCIFIIMCPVLDMISFLYRNIFNTNFSPSTITRPLIPAIVMLYLFFKKDKKFKIYSLIVGLLYIVYAIIHILLFTKLKTLSSYSNELHEMQYIINYSFMILNLFLYIHIFNNNIQKLRKSVLLAVVIYIVSIFISIITKTSSSTYIEGMGYKGWFESGNSISSILILSMFIYLPLVKNKKYRKITIPVIILVGIFLTNLIGTRVGLFGFILVITLYIIIEILYGLIKNKKINKKFIIFGLIIIFSIITVVIIFGSNTIQRRKHLKEIEANIVDASKNQQSHITGSLLEIKEKIDNDTLEANYMSKEQKQSIIDLYNICNKLEVKNNDQRMQQLIYNLVLVKNQANPILIIFGNGYMTNYRELVFEMEVLAILINFGIAGFILYLGPFITIFIYGLYIGIKNLRRLDIDYIMLLLGSGLAFALSFFSGYTFFSSSTMMIIISINTLLLKKIHDLKKEI